MYFVASGRGLVPALGPALASACDGLLILLLRSQCQPSKGRCPTLSVGRSRRCAGVARTGECFTGRRGIWRRRGRVCGDPAWPRADCRAGRLRWSARGQLLECGAVRERRRGAHLNVGRARLQAQGLCKSAAGRVRARRACGSRAVLSDCQVTRGVCTASDRSIERFASD